MTSAVLGAATLLKQSDMASPEVLTTIAEVLQIGPVGSTASETEVTNMDSGTTREYIGGLKEGAQLEFSVNFLAGNTQQEALRDGVRTTINFTVTWPDASAAAFALVVLGFNRGETTPEGQLTAEISGRITGAITWT